MTPITEQDIINHLKDKIKFHQNESKRIEKILLAFLEEPNAEDVDVSRNLDTLSSNISSKKRAGKLPARVKAKKKLIIPSEYDPNLSFVKKISFALNVIGEGYKEDIASVIVQYEPNSNVEDLSKTISGVLSSLKSRGLLRAKKEGRKDKFSIAR